MNILNLRVGSFVRLRNGEKVMVNFDDERKHLIIGSTKVYLDTYTHDGFYKSKESEFDIIDVLSTPLQLKTTYNNGFIQYHCYNVRDEGNVGNVFKQHYEKLIEENHGRITSNNIVIGDATKDSYMVTMDELGYFCTTVIYGYGGIVED